MANELLILPLHLIQSVLSQKVEAKLVNLLRRERSQGRVARRGREVACLPSLRGRAWAGVVDEKPPLCRSLSCLPLL